MRLKRIAMVLCAGFLGGLFSLATAAVASAFHLTPNFPAYAGESDFEFRFAAFGLFVVPSFIVLGAWTGGAALTGRRSWQRSVMGAMAGTAIAFVVARLLATQIATLPSAHSANVAAVVFLGTWVALAAGGVCLAGGVPRG
jgi:hypothetical protein